PIRQRARLESELGEEPPVLARLELVLQQLFRLLTSLHLFSGSLQRLSTNHVLQVHVQVIASRHHVLIVDRLNKGLNARAAGLLFLADLADDLSRLLGKAHNDGVAIWPQRRAVVLVLYNYSLLAGIAAGQEDDDLPRLQELHHFAFLSP
ncbi:hypothetical protein Vretifemale_5814, partial [Volvox reticuliferus]